MPTATQTFNGATSLMFAAGGETPVSEWYELSATQKARLREAVALWDDVSGFAGLIGVDNPDLARKTTTLVTVTETFLGIPYNTYQYWENTLPSDWTRVAVGQIVPSGTNGVNKTPVTANGRYHEVYVDATLEGVQTFQLGSTAFYTLLHEIGHSIVPGTVDGHIPGPAHLSVMNAYQYGSAYDWQAATPMTYDIDNAIATYGASTTTRTGNDTYGFNASFSGAYRAALDFSVNTRPLVTIYDNGGVDTLDASGFASGGLPSPVHVDLRPGERSYVRGTSQTFAVVYRTSQIENAVGGDGWDELSGNDLANVLTGNAGSDWFWGRGGDDAIVGGAGRDVAVFSAARSAYAIASLSDGRLSVSGSGQGAADGADTLSSVEVLQFSDGSFDLVQLGLDDFVDDASTAGSIKPGASVLGVVDRLGDHDWLRFDAVKGVTYVVRLDGISLADPKLYVFADGAFAFPVAVNDDYNGVNSQITFRASFTGTYYAAAAAYADAGAGTYRLSLFARSPSSDFDGDGRSDVLLQNSDTGAAFLWRMSGTSLSGFGAVGWTPGPQWEAKDSGDFNGDGRSDVLLQNADTGAAYLWLMDGTELVDHGPVGWKPGPSWEAKATGDFDGDGRSDILLQNADTGAAYLWLMDGTKLIGDGAVGWTPGPDWEVKGTGDFDGDGRSDVLLQDGRTGAAFVWLMDGTRLVDHGEVGWTPGPSWKARGTGDFDGDGRSDILLQNADTGAAYLWLMDGTKLVGDGPVGWVPGPAWEASGTGDYNGDGRSDILLRNADTGAAYLWLLDGTKLVGDGPVGWTPGPAWVIES